jgi:hypothetical protein
MSDDGSTSLVVVVVDVDASAGGTLRSRTYLCVLRIERIGLCFVVKSTGREGC